MKGSTATTLQDDLQVEYILRSGLPARQCHQVAGQQLLGTKPPGSPCHASCEARLRVQQHSPPPVFPPLHLPAFMGTTYVSLC